MNSQIEEKLHNILNDLLILNVEIDKSVLARHGLRRARFYILRHLYQNPGISLTHLSELSFIGAASISRIVYTLEKKGIVQRKAEQGDRRKILLSLTDAGEAQYEEANAELQADIQQRFADIHIDQLTDILRNIQILRDIVWQHQKNQEGA